MNNLHQYAESVRNLVGLREGDFYSGAEELDVVRMLMWQAYHRKLATIGEIASMFGVTKERTRDLVAKGNPICFSKRHKKFAHEVIIRNILNTMRVSKRDALGNGRKIEAVRARWVCYHILQTHLDWSTTRIGKYFNRDHTTVLHGLNGYKKEFALQEFVKMHYNYWVNFEAEMDYTRSEAVNAVPEDAGAEEPEDRAVVLGDNIKWTSPAWRRKEANARLMAGVDYSKHEYNLPNGL